ncbi:glycogen synthase [Teredinibacter purpureus]|uniref:glycogen synthase n=1 Tax=Teredinibacter purpureus TaxID=2731756 RepID=UPI000AC0AEB7|nr:glycogen/starch synthase [Teredinibacter purpureus]
MKNNKRILMVAAENDFLPGAKVGGVADVIRDLPPAIVALGAEVDVVLPSYGFLARLPGLNIVAEYEVSFGGSTHQVVLLLQTQKNGGASNYIIHHPAFSPSGETVYCNDHDRPFATDATKFAFFCAALGKALLDGALARPDVLHCHDWHTAFLLILIEFSPALQTLKTIRSVFTIHNLAMQGVRPLRGDSSSLETWYPDLHYDGQSICDPVNPHCVNPMRAAILLADKVHTVSPTYAEEILQPSDKINGLYGGEGLQDDLNGRSATGDLVGIINGSEYPKGARYADPAKKKVVALAEECLVTWASHQSELSSAHFVADKRLDYWAHKKSRGFTVTSVGRITEQKAKLLSTYVASGKTALETMLDTLSDRDQLILLGTGDAVYEDFLLRVSGRYSNFIFLNGYSHALSLYLYRYGDLFLMPSSFEPCGISQMLAMRAGQPCLVNSVGGLKDTVEHNKTGFCFSGGSAVEQAESMAGEFKRVRTLFDEEPEAWKKMMRAAGDVRFTWQQSAQSYMQELYTQ